MKQGTCKGSIPIHFSLIMRQVRYRVVLKAHCLLMGAVTMQMLGRKLTLGILCSLTQQNRNITLVGQENHKS